LADPAELPRRLPEQSSNVPNYTQVNILFPATQVELPPAEAFSAFPPEAQQALLEAFRFEQRQRHTWLRQQQTNDHELNKGTQRNYFWLRTGGLISATVLTLAILAAGVYFVSMGSSLLGFTMLVTAIGGLIGTAVWGRRADQTQTQAVEVEPEQIEQPPPQEQIGEQ
jgi:hypothetical protein